MEEGDWDLGYLLSCEGLMSYVNHSPIFRTATPSYEKFKKTCPLLFFSSPVVPLPDKLCQEDKTDFFLNDWMLDLKVLPNFSPVTPGFYTFLQVPYHSKTDVPFSLSLVLLVTCGSVPYSWRFDTGTDPDPRIRITVLRSGAYYFFS